MDVEKIIREYLPNVIHLSMATCVDNKPWACELHYAYDDDLNLYFLSKPNRRHSKEIEQNPNIAGNIVKQHSMEDKPQGVYFEGTAEKLGKTSESDPAFIAYKKRYDWISQDMIDEINKDPEGHKFYKITPKSFVVFDLVSSPDDPRQEWHPE